LRLYITPSSLHPKLISPKTVRGGERGTERLRERCEHLDFRERKDRARWIEEYQKK
jgi:hypothetical protein